MQHLTPNTYSGKRMNDIHKKMQTVYLGLGSSIGDRIQNLCDALQYIGTKSDDVKIVALSHCYESPHLGLEPSDEEKYPPHLNCALKIETSLSPEELLSFIQTAEDLGKRQRTQKWGPRTIDIDILLYENETRNTAKLTLPHPGLTQRAFVVFPLYDIAPNLRLPDGQLLADLVKNETVQSQSLENLSTIEKSTNPK